MSPQDPFDNIMQFATLMPFRLVILFLAVSTASGQNTDDLIQNVYARSVTSLDGQWGVIVDPYETGYYNHRFEPSPTGFFRDAKMQEPSDLIEYDFYSGPTLTVPGDWNTQSEQLFLYEGTIWYKRTFTYAKANGQRAFLYFGAANYEARVYVNGEQAGIHIGGFTPFNIDVTDKLNSGSNTVVVKVDNKRRRDGVPTVNTDWWNYGGLTRSVMLVNVPSTFIRDYVLQLNPESPDAILGWVQLDGPDAANQNVKVDIAEANLSATVVTDDRGFASIELPARVERWAPDNPKLYDVEFTTDVDVVNDQIGFRSIEQRGEEILLNGEPVFLRGISIHEEKAFGGGRANSTEDATVLLSWVKEMNGNFVRLAHYPHNEHMVREADRMGFLVWAEVPVYWTVQFGDASVYANAEAQLTEMVKRDRNRAAVILWSVANETPLSEDRLGFLSSLAETARGLDPTRLITAALDTQSREE
ncbi:MAG: beta-glucuronidase, partial [Rhodothermales bacterium]|nr:beta-glucuronidase [Rhodothermales bacterium]